MLLSKRKMYIELANRNMTVKKLAKKYGCTEQGIYGFLSEGKKLRITTIKRLADAIGCSVEDILADE